MRKLQALDLSASFGPNLEDKELRRLIDTNGYSRLDQHQWSIAARAVQVISEALRVEGAPPLTASELADALPVVADEGVQFLDEEFYPTLLEMFDTGKIVANAGKADLVEAWSEYELPEKVELFTQMLGANGVAIFQVPSLIPFVQRLAATALLYSLDDAMIAEFLDGRGLPTVLRLVERLSAHIEPPHNMLAMIRTAKQMALSERGADAALSRHGESNNARAWVQSEWLEHREAYGGNKSAFARDYVRRVRNERGVVVTEKQMREVWLKDTPSAGNPAG